MDAQLAEIGQLPQARKTAAYLSLLSQLVSKPSAPELGAFAESASSEAAGLVVSKQVLTELVGKLGEIKDRDIRKAAIEAVLGKLGGRVVSFEEQVSALREALATLQEEEEDWTEAARTLQGIPLESGHRVVSDEYKLNIYVRIVRLLLEDDDATSAESYYNRASLLIHSTANRETQLHFKLSQARILDSKRRFADAALRYHELSYFVELAEEERLQCLGAAVTCAVLAPAGPNRSRILATLYRDERSASLPDYTILSKMFLDQIIRPGELKEFESRLAPHQLARLPPTSIILAENDDDEAPLEGLARGKKGPETVLDRAVMQHNLLAASRIYNNITFRGLGALLSLTPTAAEAMARTMIQEKRLKGSIDQVEGLITFEARKKGDEGVVSNVAVAGDKDDEGTGNIAPSTARWDDAIRSTSQKVESISEHIVKLLAVSA